MAIQRTYLVDNTHQFISGDTGAGKSVVGKWLHVETSRVSIFVDPMRICPWGVTCDSVTEVIAALADNKHTIRFIPAWDSSSYDQMTELVAALFEIANNATDTKFQIVIDEVHNWAKNGDDDSPVVRCYKEGRNFDIKTIGISQEPQMVHKSAMRQGYKVWVGGVSDWALPYLEGYNMPVERIQKNDDTHRALVMDKNNEIIDEWTAPEDYTREP